MKTITILCEHLDFGGIERYISLLCNMLENNFKISLLVKYKFNEKPAFKFSNKVSIQYMFEGNPYDTSAKVLIKNKKYIKLFKELVRRNKIKLTAKKRFIKNIKKINTDYIITTRVSQNEIVNKYLKNKCIIKIATEHNYHNNNEIYINRFINSVSNFDYVIHCTKELYDFYKPIINGPKNILIHNPIEINNFEKSKLNTKNIISVGRLSEEKGFLDLIDVMNKINTLDNKVYLTICGDGYEREKIEKKIKELKVKNIKMTGFLNTKELEKEYLNSSVYVMPSKSEAFGLVLLEAMNYGLPCISFDSASGARELLQNDVGILIKNRDKNLMAKEITDLINDKNKLKQYQNKSLKQVQNYSIENIKKEWLKILE